MKLLQLQFLCLLVLSSFCQGDSDSDLNLELIDCVRKELEAVEGTAVLSIDTVNGEKDGEKVRKIVRIADGPLMKMEGKTLFLKHLENYPMVPWDGYPENVEKAVFCDYKGFIFVRPDGVEYQYIIEFGFADQLRISKTTRAKNGKDGDVLEQSDWMIWFDSERMLGELGSLRYRSSPSKLDRIKK